MEYLFKFCGSEKMLFASDYPWVEIDTILHYLNMTDLSKHDKMNIMGDDAAKIFNI